MRQRATRRTARQLGPNGSNGRIVQLRARVRDALDVRSVLDAICRVAGACIPAEVRRHVVRPAVVAVCHFLEWIVGDTMKRERDEPVDPFGPGLRVTRQRDLQISAGVAGSEDLPGTRAARGQYAAHSPMR
ncbi:hypothetical protein AQ753_17490 [Burkholderia pseudomallei]|nr:hypothetical protein AQ753_17490 [Burkholderia pseudomallei]